MDIGLVANVPQMRAVLNNTSKPTLVKDFSKIKAQNALAFPIILYGSEIWTPIKFIKKIGIKRNEIFQKNSRVQHF
jgi:hypothetical protein